VKYLISLEPDHGHIDIHAWDEYAFRHTCENGHLDVVKYLISLEPDHNRIDIHAYDEYAFEQSNNTIRHHLVKHDPEYNWKKVDGYKSYRRKLNQNIRNLSLLHQKMIQIDTDILELNVVEIVKEFLL
jgi:hypothetical protein